MGMGSIQFFQNKYYYPHYSDTLVTYGIPMDCTPVGMNLRSGTLRVKGNMTDFMSCNYLSFTRDTQTLYAWIDDVKFHTENSFEVTYSVDAWRTFKNKIDLGVQYIDRRPNPTSQRDPLLGAEQDYPNITSTTHFMSTPTKRIFVVQARPQGGTYSSTPVQPTPYQFYFIEYDTSDWTQTAPLLNLMIALEGSPETANLVTMYSIPYMDISSLSTADLVVSYPDNSSDTISGFKILGVQSNTAHDLAEEIPLTFNENIDELLRIDHSVQIVIPEAGILNVSDELLKTPNLKLRRDIDLFSGACNYMLMSTDGEGQDHYYADSVRGSSITSIPILSDPLETYMSQNQNALATSLIGDVASIAGGAALLTPMGRAAGAALGAGGLTAGAGVFSMYSGVNSMIDRKASIQDAGNRYSNPPAFLGSAMAGYFNNTYWIVVTKEPVDNATDVHTHYGYQYGKVTSLNVPSSGFIKTEGCNVKTTDGTVPRWAIEEINAIFNNGIQVH